MPNVPYQSLKTNWMNLFIFCRHEDSRNSNDVKLWHRERILAIHEVRIHQVNCKEKSLMTKMISISDFEQPVNHFRPHSPCYMVISQDFRFMVLNWSFGSILLTSSFFSIWHPRTHKISRDLGGQSHRVLWTHSCGLNRSFTMNSIFFEVDPKLFFFWV